MARLLLEHCKKVFVGKTHQHLMGTMKSFPITGTSNASLTSMNHHFPSNELVVSIKVPEELVTLVVSVNTGATLAVYIT